MYKKVDADLIEHMLMVASMVPTIHYTLEFSDHTDLQNQGPDSIAVLKSKDAKGEVPYTSKFAA